MHRTGKLSLRIIDAAGGCLVAAGVCGLCWATVFREQRAAGEVQTMTSLIRSADQEGRVLRAALDKERGLLEKREIELAKGGRLPLQAPLEQYFRALSAMATDHRLRVVQHYPLPARAYPGLLEERYAFEVVGSFPDLLRFLRAIEQTDYWADVGYLKLDRGSGPEAGSSERRAAVLTLSLFAASPAGDPPARGGT